MPTATIRFTMCIQDSQDYGSDDEHMVSRVFLDLEADGKRYANLTVDIKQTVGDNFETGQLEVAIPRGYDGSLNYAPFRDAVEKYFRSLVGSAGRGIRISGGSNIRMRDNTFSFPATDTFEYSASSTSW